MVRASFAVLYVDTKRVKQVGVSLGRALNCVCSTGREWYTEGSTARTGD